MLNGVSVERRLYLQAISFAAISLNYCQYYHTCNQQSLPLRTVGLSYMLMILFCFLQVHPEGKFVVDLDKSIDMSEVR